jgi:CheY-like chemotaxis protein
MDGYQLAQKIRRQEEHQGWYLPIVALTAGAMESDAQRCYAMGMDDYLTKPVTLAVLNAMVVKHLPVVDDMRVLVDEVNDVVPEAHVVANNGHIEDAVLAHEGLGSVVEQTIDVVLIKQTFGDDLVMMQEMLHLFLDTTRPLVDLAVANMQAQKWQQARDAVHEMIGAAGAAGAPALARTGQEAEALLHAEDFVAAALAVGRLPVQFDACDVAIKAFLKQQSQA